MGAGAGAAAAIENEPSPRRAAIEKAQAELRREVAVREERRRELEFLEKGGELLDFFSATNSAFPSSSQLDPLADQLVSSEAEGGYASVALANGDSLENSVGTSCLVGRGLEGGDHHAGDDGASTASESLTLAWEGKFRAPRTGSTSLRSHADVNLKRESEGAGGGRVGVKGQAYSRRNRQRSNRFGNGYTPAREVDKVVESSSTPSFEVKGLPTPPIVSVEVCKGNESMVEKNAQPLLVHLALPSTSGHRVSLGVANVNDHLEGSTVHLVKLPEPQPDKHAPTSDTTTNHGKLPTSSRPAVAECSTLSRGSDVKDVVCTDFNLRENLPIGADLDKSDHLLLTPCLEENVGIREGSAAVSQLLKPLRNSQPALDKEGALPIVVKDESSVIMVREKNSVPGHLSPHLAKSDYKNKKSVSQTQRAIDRSTTIPSNHVPDFATIVPNMDDKRFVQLEVAGAVQVMPRSLNSSENRSNTTRKTTSTASSGAPDVTKSGQAMANEKNLGSARVEVKIEEGFSEVGTRLSAVDTEFEDGHDVKNVRVISLPQEEIRTEGQTTPVSVGSNRTGFRTPGSLTASNKFPGVVLPWEKEKDPNVIAEAERHKADLSAKAKKAHEDYIIEEAEIIKTGKKDTAEWGKRRPEAEPMRRKSHWDFLLEEMAWMANDFMQERLWKMACASQVSRLIAQCKGQSEFQATDIKRRQKKVAHILANAVNEFWRSIELTMYKEKGQTFSNVNTRGQEISARVKDDGEAVPMDVDVPAVAESSGRQLLLQQVSKRSLPLQGYGKRFLRESLGIDLAIQAEAPSTPERTSEASSILDPFWEEQYSEEPLFYTVPNGAFEAYRYSIETQRALIEADYEQTLQEQAAALAEAEAQAVAEAVATSDFMVSCGDDGQSLARLSSPSKGIRADDDGAQYGLLHSSIAKKKRKNILKSNSAKMEGLPSSGLPRPLAFLGFDSGGGLPSPLVTGKRSLPGGGTPTSANVGSIPTKRMRSGMTRQRLGTASPSSFPSPVGLLNRTTFSSGALNSNHDEGHNLAECTISLRKESDAAGATGKNILGHGSTNSFLNSKSKKKKKTKHFSGALSSTFKADGAASGNTGSTLNPVESEHHSVYDQLKRKGDQQHVGSLEVSTGGIGSSAETPETPLSQGQQPSKKAKLSKQASDINSDAVAAAISVPATQVASIVANPSSTSKLLRQNSNRDRNRKSRSNKVSVSQPAGIGIPWSTIEDQAILALVHDLGPNWELVSDVLSSSSQLKGIFRRPKQCKDRHKALMDRLSVGEGGDSPEDPSTSQPHPSTLPGIPKGSARVLLQRLQGPVEEDTLKVHLEHIVRVVQKGRALKPQNDEPKLLVAPHPSHMSAVSQFCNSGSAGGCPTPLELCDLSAANAELGTQAYQMPGPHPGVLPSGSGIRPATNGLPAMPGASSVHMGGPAMPPSSAAATAARDVHRLAAMRPFSPDEHRARYVRAMAARGISVPGGPVTAGLPMMALASQNDHSIPMLAASNNVGMMGGLSRGVSLSRAGLPGMGSPGVSGMGSPTLGSMLPPGGVVMAGAGPSVGSAGVPNQVNIMRRPTRDQMVRTVRNNEEQRQNFIQQLQQQAAQGNTEAQTALTTAFSRDLSNPLIPVPPQNFSSQQHPTEQQQQYMVAARIVKERQQFQHKQRLMQQQLQQPTSLPLPLQQQQQQQQLHPMPQQQHVLLQQSHLPQHQHLLPQQHPLQKQQSQQIPQQPGLPLPSSPLQPMAAPSMSSNHQQQHQALSQSQSVPQQQLQPSGQVSQLTVQSKLQQPKQLQKHQHLHQSSQALQQQAQQQQQQPRGSKGVVRGSMLLQALPSQPGQANIVPGNVALGNQLAQQLPGQTMSHSMPVSRSLQPQVPVSMGKQLSQPQGMTGQAGQMQAQQTVAVAGSSTQGHVGQQQKVLQQQLPVPLPSKQQQASPPVHPSTPGLSSQQQQLSPPAQQSQIVPPQQGQQRRQPQQQTQLQQFGQRRLQQRQPGSSIVPMAGHLTKAGSSQQSQISPQISSQSGHVTYPLGTNMAGSMSMVGTAPVTLQLPPLGSSSNPGVHSTQWKPGQTVSTMSTGIYNLSRSGNSGTAPIPSVSNTSGMHMASPNGTMGMSMSSSSTHGVTVGGLQVGSGPHAQKTANAPGTNSRATTVTPQGGAQRPSQQHHGNLTMSLAQGAGQVKHPTPTSTGGVMPVSTLGPSTVAGVPQSGSIGFPGSSVPAAGHSAPLANSMPTFGVQPWQSHGSNAALTTTSLPQKSAAPTTAISSSSGVSAGSPAPGIPPSGATNPTVADQSTSS